MQPNHCPVKSAYIHIRHDSSLERHPTNDRPEGNIFKLDLNENEAAIATEPLEMFHSENRYRDLAFSPDGSTLYVITDLSGPAQAIGGGATTELWNPGALPEFRYIGSNSTTP